MPEVYMQIEWPGNKKDVVYSPSSIIYEHFKKGEAFSVDMFEKKVTEALTQASQRVLAKFGYECTSAMGEIMRIQSIVNSLKDKSQEVKITQL